MYSATCIGLPMYRLARTSSAPMPLRILQVLHQGGGAGSVTSTLHLSLGLARRGRGGPLRLSAGLRGRSARPRRRARGAAAGPPRRRAPRQRRRARRTARAAPGRPGQLAERSRPPGAHLAGAHGPAPGAAGADPPADAADVLPGELACQPGGDAGHRREPAGRGGAPAEGHPRREAGRHPQRSRGRAGGPPSERGRGAGLARAHRLDAGAAHRGHRGATQGSARGARGPAAGADAGAARARGYRSGRPDRAGGAAGRPCRTPSSACRSPPTCGRSTTCSTWSCCRPGSKGSRSRCSRRWRSASR